MAQECGLPLCVMISQETNETEFIIFDEALKFGI